MTAIIIGANGQDGYYLSELLKENGVTVVGVSKRRFSSNGYYEI